MRNSTVMGNMDLMAEEHILLSERQQLALWYKQTKRLNLKLAIRQEIAEIDDELRNLNDIHGYKQLSN